MATTTTTTDGVGPHVDQRPDFLELCHHHDGGEVVERYATDIRASLAQVTSGTTDVAWLQGQSCTGCTMSMLQNEFPAIEGVLSEFREQVSFHPTLMDSAGEAAMDSLASEPDILIVEGAVPVEIPQAATLGRDERGNPKPIVDWVIELAEAADLVVAVGSCSAYGGLPAAGRHDSGDVGADPTGARGLQFDGREPGGVFGPDFQTGRGLPVVNVPGCPAHPEHVLLTLATVLNGHDPTLDEFNRPLPIFGPLVHDDCSLREEYEDGNFADHPGDDGCLYEAGCAGVYAYCDDSKRLRNGGTTICRDVGAPCIGCVEPAFWDRFTPFYETGLDRGETCCDGPSGIDYYETADGGERDDSPDGPFDAVTGPWSETSPVGLAMGALLSLVVVPLLPGLAAGAAVLRWLGLGGRGPSGPTSFTETSDRPTEDA
jgi:hydrogenase small subunit